MLTYKDLLANVSASVKSIHESWKRDKKIDPFLMTWSISPVRTDDGKTIEGPYVLNLPEDRKEWRRLMIQAIGRTDAYALLVVEERDDEVRAVLEATSGSRCWRMPLARSGDTKRLGLARVTDDEEILKVLWRRD